MAEVGDGENEVVTKKLEKTRCLLRKPNRDLKQFYEELKKGWNEPDCRIIGHLRSSPGKYYC